MLDHDAQESAIIFAGIRNNRISGQLLRSVLPSGWSIADRTGAGKNGSRAIVAKIWNTEGQGYIINIYLTETDLSFKQRNRVVAEVGEQIFKEYLSKI